MTCEVNILILGNKKVHAQLLAKLRVAEVRRQREHEQRFALRLAAWRAACHAHALSLFKEHMATAAVVAPEECRSVLQQLRTAQAAFSAERVALLRSLAELDEARLTRATGAAKAAEAAELAARQGEMHSSFLRQLREADAAGVPRPRLEGKAAVQEEVGAPQPIGGCPWVLARALRVLARPLSQV
jgi:hypothetical protein